MISRGVVADAVLFTLVVLTADAVAAPENAAAEYARHFGALSKLSVAVARAMPPEPAPSGLTLNP